MRAGIGALVLAALLAAGPSAAQAPSAAPPPSPAPGAPPQGGPAQQAPPGGTMRGTVVSVQPEQGRLVLAGPQGNVQVNGAPRQLFGLEPGSEASFAYGNYGGQLWVSSRAGVGGPEELEGARGEFGQLVGAVQQVDPVGGRLVVEGRQLRAHPEFLKDLQAGEQVALSYRIVGSTAWVVGLQEPARPGSELPPPPGGSMGVQQNGKPPGPGYGTQGTGGDLPGLGEPAAPPPRR